MRMLGIGIETTPGVEASTFLWIPIEKGNLNPKVESVKDDSAIGRRENLTNSKIAQKWAEPEIEGKAYSKMIGYLMKGILGSNTVSGSGTFTHTMTVLNSNASGFPTFSVCVKDAVGAQLSLGCILSELTVKSVKGSYLTYAAKFVGKFPASTTKSPAYTEENLFVASSAELKFAANIAGLGAATAASYESFELTLSNSAIRSGIASDLSPERIYPGNFSVSGSVEAVFDSATTRDLFVAHTAQAIRLAASSVGTESLTIDLAQVRLEEYGTSDGLDDEVTQSIAIMPEYKQTESKLIEVKLINSTATY